MRGVRMKLIIDIPEIEYNTRKIMGYFSDNFKILEAVANGTPIPDNATNGDIVRMMFPKLEYKYAVIDEYTNKPTFVQIIDGDMILTNFSTDWWNAPYQKGGKE